jgi:hypothetical protein
VTGVPQDLSGTQAYQGRPLAGSPAGRLQNAAAEILAAGTLPRCPHTDQPPLWYLPAGHREPEAHAQARGGQQQRVGDRLVAHHEPAGDQQESFSRASGRTRAGVPW